MFLWCVKYKKWNSTFSDLIDCEMLSIGSDEENAIIKVRRKVRNDCRDFKATKINSIMGHEIKVV